MEQGQRGGRDREVVGPLGGPSDYSGHHKGGPRGRTLNARLTRRVPLITAKPVAVDRGDQRLSDVPELERQRQLPRIWERKDWHWLVKLNRYGGGWRRGTESPGKQQPGPGLQGAAGLSLEEGEGLPGSVPWEAQVPWEVPTASKGKGGARQGERSRRG